MGWTAQPDPMEPIVPFLELMKQSPGVDPLALAKRYDWGVGWEVLSVSVDPWVKRFFPSGRGGYHIRDE